MHGNDNGRMPVDFPAVERTRLSDQIAGRLQEAIAEGRYRSGERLPSELELAATFKTSRGTVREALRALQAMGWVDIRTGAGAFVAESPFGPQALNERLNWVRDRREDILKILEVRSALQSLAARKTAERVKPADIRMFEDFLGEMRQAVAAQDADRFARLDLRFHSGIGALCGNQMLRDIVDYVEEVYRASNRALVDMQGRIAQSLSEHEQIVAAFARRDSEAAEAAMRRHVDNVQDTIAVLAAKEAR